MGYSTILVMSPTQNLSYLNSMNWADSQTEPKVWGRVEIQGSYLLFTCEDNIQVLQEERMLAQSGALRVADSWSVRRNKDSPYWIPERWTSNWQLYQAIFIFTTLDSSRPHRDSNWRIRIFLYDFDLEMKQVNNLPVDLPDPILSGSSSPVSILARMFLLHFKKASSTAWPVLADVSKNINPFSWANL